jgi:hypothetical protein
VSRILWIFRIAGIDYRIYEDPIVCMVRLGRIGFEVIHFNNYTFK